MLTYDDFHAQMVDQFDMQEFKDAIGPGYSDELLMYPLFYRQMVFRRIGDLNRLWDISDFKEFPVGSIVHLLDDNFLMNKPIVFVPDVEGWSMTRDPYRKYILHISEPPAESWVRNIEKLFLPQQGVVVTLLNFRKRYQSYIRTCNDAKDLPGASRTQVQTLMCYDSLYRARIFGLLRSVRRFNFIFGHLLNNIAKYPERIHFIPIPVGTKQFDRNMFLRTFKEHNRATIKYPEDNWYLFCMHLLGFVHGEPTKSIFENIPKDMWNKIHFVLYTKTKVLTLRLDHLKEFNGPNDVIMIRLIKQLNSLAESGNIVTERDFSEVPANIDTEEDKTLPDELLPPDAPFEEKVNVTISKQSTTKPADVPAKKEEPVKSDPVKSEDEPKQADTPKDEPVKSPIVHTWGFTPTGKTTSKKEVEETPDPEQKQEEPVKPVEKKEEPKPQPPPAKPKLEQPIPTPILKKVEERLEGEREIKVEDLTVDDKWLTVQPKKEQLNSPEFKKPITKQEQVVFNNAMVDHLDKVTMETIQANEQLTAAQRNRAINLANAYKSIKVGDQTIEQVIRSTPDDSVSENSLDFLKDDVADESMLHSSVETFEHDYMQKMFKRDLLAELVSFNKVGMFLKDVQVTDTSDSLNSTETYVAKYEDINHKEHTIRFVLPKVDERGFCRVNGTLKVLKKQRVPNPICKVSRTRVTLNSDYNKYLVERNTAVAHSFVSYVDRIIKASEGQIKAILGSHTYVDRTLPYEYTTVASKYSKIEITPADKTTPWVLFFEPAMFADITSNKFVFSRDMQLAARDTANNRGGIIVGVSQDKEIAILNIDGSMTIIDCKDDHEVETTTFIDFLCDKVQVTLNGLSEWTDFKLLNKSVPTIFALCYRFGLSHMLNYTKTPYQVYNKGQRFPRRMSDVVIRFADKTLVIPRCPLVSSMLFAGLNNYDLRNIDMEQMDSKDIYYELIQSKKISVHNLKGIDNFFDYFVDPITADVLHQMGEPIDPKDLLIRATQLLTTEDHKPVASSTNFRFRSYERINSAVYKVLSRAHATYRYKSLGASNKFSIADYEIKQLVVQDQLMENVDLINPINDIKYQHEYSHAGFGGRQSIDTFMIDDRQFPADGTGIISEATVDSSKTAYAGSMTMDPTIMNMRGMTVVKDTKELKPTQILSPTSVLVPCVTLDDGKRTNLD